ncbi:D-(-)-3-hydroxybutyrate oligomer hydrolase [Skermanella aerolata]|uniref:D-(-)-3-hydroxybutyrate oligomer hydrolase n=1 Tax=Skermanella aerolata TaxID=393310 RepID=A0A512E0W0_9PROT|nr:3-hydroxybutyrate oligomer hydrolase family protein [Skermanella aerolata]GEO42325.1 D-(-)-3-hydroxybutyrate oligomer hydrolase [Skermanella aerolata]
MGRMAATVASTLCLLIGMAPVAMAKDGRDDDDDGRKGRPDRIEEQILGKVLRADYDGLSNDLLTAGLGATGLTGAAPAAANPVAPTPEELRRLAIYNNYRALVDVSPGGGYGTLYGPLVGAGGQAAARDGKIAGTEYLALLDGKHGGKHDGHSDDDDGNSRVTVALQVPETFDPANACMVTATSSGSRGVYGAIGTSGEWGLKKGCAVVYVDKGTGTGFFDLQNRKGYTVQGEFVDADRTVEPLNFDPKIPGRELERYNKDNPNRWAIKHAHSQENPEEDWGTDTLRAIQFGFYELNRHFADEKAAPRITPANTLVIASSVSNGGAAALRAAEEDKKGWIDGVAVSEPNVNPKRDRSFTIQQGSGQPIAEHGRPLYDYITFYTLYEGCAAATSANARAAKVCTDLKSRGLINSGGPVEAQAAEAQEKIRQHGILPEQNVLAAFYWSVNVYQSVAVAYANTYSRSSVTDNLCGFSYAFADATDKPAPLPAANAALAFSGSNGVPPTVGIQLIRNGVSATTVGGVAAPMADVDGAVCLRNLWTAGDNSRKGGDDRNPAKRLSKGVEDVLTTSALRGKPAVIVHGRSDALIAVNHSSRSYYGSALKKRQNIRYYEVTNAHHLDAFNALPGFNAAFIPLHVYFIEGLDRLYDHLKSGKQLPPSQVVHTVPRGTGAPPITTANVPPIAETVADKDRITFDGSVLRIPE